MSEMKGLALLSGGLDSSVACFLFQENHQIELAITMDYGQRALQQEITAARMISQLLGAEHQVFEIPFLKQNLRGALQDENASMPHLKSSDLDDPDLTRSSASAVWVPNRNGLMIESAASVAEARGIEKIIVGFNREEAVTFPDNSPEYLTAINHALSFSTLGRVEVISPTLHLDKKEIVQAGRKMKVPFEFLWSCYEGGDTPCHECESCLRFDRAIKD